MAAARFIVTGHVQGVFYRASTRTRATRLGLDGYARNLADGTVEVLAGGADADLDALQRWLQQGPPAARVESVRREDVDLVVPPGFRCA